MSRAALAWTRIRGSLRSALARSRRPAAPEPSRRITTAEAWDLWREACCDERGGHHWETWKYLGRGCGPMTFTCGCCPATLDVYPAGDRIRLPWGITVPVVTRTCKRCGTEFRQVMTSTTVQEYCSRSHATAARRARNRPERMAAHEARIRAEQEAARSRARLEACTEKGKLRYEDERSAALAAGSHELRYGNRTYPYECPCGSWHLTREPPDARQRAEELKRVLFGSAAS